MFKTEKIRRFKLITIITILLFMSFSVIPFSILAMDEATNNLDENNHAEVMNDADVTKDQEVSSDPNMTNDTDDNTEQNDSEALEEDDSVIANRNPLQGSNPAEEKAITLFKDGTVVGDFDTLKQAINEMHELTKDGSKFKFIVQVNKDIDLTEYSQFSWPYGNVTLKSKDPANPVTIKANNTDHVMMLGVVNGADLTVENIIIDGNNAKRLFWVESTEALPAHLTINEGAILQNGKVQESDQTKYGGAIFCQYAGFVIINGGIIKNNEAILQGGAICYIGTKELTINGGEITENKTLNSSGGGIYFQGKGQIKGGKIYANTAKNGGAIATGTNAHLEVSGGEIINNTASYAGGGIYLLSNSTVKLSGGLVSANKARYGGGVTATDNSNFIMEGNGIISENEAYTGGGFYPWGTTPSCDLISGTIEKNKANFGGGIRLRSPKSKIGGVVIQENIAKYGGGIYSSLPSEETLTIDDVKLYKNEALSGGGVCLTDENGTLNFKNAEFKENKAYYGGGIWTSHTMTIEKSTFEGNEAIKSDEPLDSEGNPENMGHGGAIYVNTALAKDGKVIIDGCTFTKNKADKSGGAISVDETKGLLQVKNNTQFIRNEATGILGHGGAIYSNWHPYKAKYDDGTEGPIENPPDSDKYYYNIDTDKSTVFKDNKAFYTFTPPINKDKFIKLLSSRTSHPGTKYDHPLNNDDVNFIVFCNVIFDKNYDTDDRIHDAFLVFEGTKLEKDFPTNPVREGYKFKGWNTRKDGKGTAFKADTEINENITLYAQWEKAKNEPPQIKVKDIKIANSPRTGDTSGIGISTLLLGLAAALITVSAINKKREK